MGQAFPFSDKWIVRTGGPGKIGMEVGLKARPTVGGHFAILALKGAKYLMW